MTLNVKLTCEEQHRLDVIVAATLSSNRSEAVRALINEKYEALQTNLTLVERRGGHPRHVMNGDTDMSERSNRKSRLDSLLAQKIARRAE